MFSGMPLMQLSLCLSCVIYFCFLPFAFDSITYAYVRSREECPSVDDFLKHKLMDSLSAPEVTDLQQAVSGPKTGFVVITSKQVLCMTDNFLVHARKATPGVKLVDVCLDQVAYDYCLNQKADTSIKISCVNLMTWTESNIKAFGRDLAGQADVVPFGSCPYQLLVWLKPLVLLRAAEASENGIMMIDLDIILHADLLGWTVQNNDAGSLLMTGTEHNHSAYPNTGTLFATKKSIHLLKTWVALARIGSATGDQDGLTNLLHNAGNEYYDIKILHNIKMIPHDVLGQCANSAQVATHYNCVSSKIETMKKNDVWKTLLPECQF